MKTQKKGKTSFLRRYFTGKFEHNYRKSTLGADFYSTILPNPYYNYEDNFNNSDDDSDSSDVYDRNEIIDQDQYDDHGSCCSCSTSSSSIKSASMKTTSSSSDNQSQSKTNRKILEISNQELGRDKSERKKHKKKKAKKKKKKKATRDRDRQSPMMMIPEKLSDGVISNSFAVTDTIDETCTSSNISIHIDAETTNDNNHRKTRTKRKNKYIRQSKQIALQMWDTAGKERFSSAESTKGLLTSRLGDSFFTHADVAILIYDATSSKSFLQLIKWYSELLDRVKKVNLNEKTSHNDNNNNDDDRYCTSSKGLENTDSKRKFPVLIVATKLDRLKAELSRQARKKIVPQRDVLGLKGKAFNGQEYHYEYTVRSSSISSRNINSDSPSNITTPATADAPLSYGLEGGAWTSDTEYLDYLGVAEDASFPDRYMVLLWCKRNGLKHVEVSALDGMGVNETVKTVVDLAIDSSSEKKTICNNEVHKLDQRNGPIDFHDKHGSNQEDNCNFCRWFTRK